MKTEICWVGKVSDVLRAAQRDSIVFLLCHARSDGPDIWVIDQV